MSFEIAGLQKTTFIDYPEKIACIVFTQGCNFSCGYCHNPELFEHKEPALLVPAFFEFLKTRKGKLDGVVITGGEPTLHKELKEFIKQIKSLGFLVKLDTNGTNPELLKELFDENLLDFVAMDIKAPFNKYEQITRTNVNLEKIKKSIDLIINGEVNYEFRTTVVKSQLSLEDFKQISELIKGAKKYYLQKFLPTKTLDEKMMRETSYTDEEFAEICNLFKNNVEFVDFR